MAQGNLSEQKLKEIREFAAEWGKIVARRAFPGEAVSLDFSAMEQVALAAAAGLTEGTLGVLLHQRAQALGPEHPCPGCGTPCPVGHEDRPLTVKGGAQVPLHEPVCHCPACRRDFSPPRPRLRLDGHSHSPSVLLMISQAAGRLQSFRDAAFAPRIADVQISPRHAGRIAHEVGSELTRERDHDVERRRRTA